MDNLWAITAYFNPMHWRRRRDNYRQFRQALRLPLVAVELGYDGQFDLAPGDADVLLQFPAADVMWQKERLLNLALAAVPPHVDKVVAIDSDVIFARDDVWPDVNRALDEAPLLHPFSQVYYLPPVSYGLAWAFRRELFAERGFYDPWIIGGGTRVHCFAAGGHAHDAADAMQFTPSMRDHFRAWTEGFHADVRDRWGFLPGAIAHLWHGTTGGRKFRQRYTDFAAFDFDPAHDLALDANGVWRWASDKPAMHDYLCLYFAGRREDDDK